MKTFIANFGVANYLWPRCKAEATVATFEDEDLHPFWECGDRDGYIAYAVANKKSANGVTPPRNLASRWFNLATIVSETYDDLWLHREKDELWWTVTKPDSVQVTLEPSSEPDRTGARVYVFQKPAHPWSNKNKKGGRLVWQALHPHAREFLFNQGTLQELREINAAYAQALIAGADLAPWHSQSSWVAKEEKSGKALVTVYSSAQRTAYRMANTAMATALGSNGQEVLRTLKNKEFRFSSEGALQAYLEALLIDQDNACAITALPLQFDGDDADPEMLCSLDRIDSSGHYEEGNLQVVCRFVNRWKSDSDDTEFRRLISVLQGAGMSA